MPTLAFLQPLAPLLSAVLVAVIVDIALRLVAAGRDRVDPLWGFPSAMAARLQRKLDRSERTKNVRLARGRITLGFMVLVGLMLGAGLQGIAFLRPAFEPIIWFFCLKLTFVWTASVEIIKLWPQTDREFVAKGKEVLARRRVPVLVPSANPDRHAIARMVIEAAATSIHRGLLAPVLWAVVAKFAGFPPILAAVLVVCLNEGERVIVTQQAKNSAFAHAFEVMDAVINFVPARIAALFLVLGAVFTPAANPLSALRAMFTQGDAHRGVNDGWPVAAMANALRVALPGGRKGEAWLGPKNATAKATARDVQRALWLHGVTVAVIVLVLTGVLFLSLAG